MRDFVVVALFCVAPYFSVEVYAQEALSARIPVQPAGAPPAESTVPQTLGLIERGSEASYAGALGYRLGPGDTLQVWVRDSDEIGGRGYRVSPDGTVRLPLLGRVPAAGLTTEELEESLVARLDEFLYEPDVLVTVEAYGSRPVAMLGQVQNPGNIYLKGPTTLLEAISAVGGLNASASYHAVISRDPNHGLIPTGDAEPRIVDGRQIVEVDLGELMTGVSARGNVILAANDVVTVQKAEVIYVLGAVNRAGGFVMSRERRVTVLQAVAMAEGWNKTASASKAHILRATDNSKRRELPVDLKKVMSGEAEDLLLMPDDILFVPGSKSKQLARSVLTAAGAVATSIVIWRVGRP